jgi:hypothetical protein
MIRNSNNWKKELIIITEGETKNSVSSIETLENIIIFNNKHKILIILKF